MRSARGRLLGAMRPYLIRRRLIGAGSGLLLGLALAGALITILVLALGREALGTPLVRLALVTSVALPTLIKAAMPLKPIDAALAIERAFPFLQDRVATAVDLLTREPGRIPRSEAHALRVADEAADALDDLPVARAAPAHPLRTSALIAALGLGAAALAWAAAPVSRAPEPVQPAPPVVDDRPQPEPLPPPRIFDLSVAIAPPSHTGLPRRTIGDPQDEIRAPLGSEITISGVCSREDARVTLETEAGATARLPQASGGRVSHAVRLSEPIRWRLRARAREDATATSWREIVPIADARPHVRITRPDGDVTLQMAEPVGITVAAGDDYGISALGLRMRLSDEDDWHSMPLDFTPGASTSASARLNPTGVGLQPGGELIVRASATDNDAVAGPKTALSEPLRIRLEQIAGEEPAREPESPVEEAQRKEADAMEQLQRTARELERQLDEAIEGAQGQMQTRPGEAGEAREMPTRPGMELQEAARRLQEQAGRLEEAMREAEQELKAQKDLSPELVEKVRELHELMRDVMDEDLRKALEELQNAVQAQDMEEMRMSLEAAREAQKRFTERLEQTLSLLKRARMEAMLEQLRRQAEKLAKRQSELSERTGELSAGRSEASRKTERDQRGLARDTEPLAERIEAAVESAREIDENLAVSLGAIADRLRHEEPVGQMRQAASALGRGSPSDAAEPQSQAGRSLHRAASELAELAEQFASDFTAEARRKLAEMLRDTLSLSHSQETLGEDVRELGERRRTDLLRDKRPIDPLRRRQTTLVVATRKLAGRIEELAGQTPAMNPALASSTQVIADAMAQAARDVEGADLTSALMRGRNAMTGLNEVARLLLETDEQLSQQSAQSALSQYMERLKSLAQRQQQLNQQTGQAQKPGQSGQRRQGQRPGMSLSQMAYEQSMIRQALKKMLQEGREGEGTKPVADQLGETPEEMEKVEGDLRSGRIKRETVERQERILEKMLEAQRSLYTKEKERSERKAERPEAFEPPPSPPARAASLPPHPPVEVERGRGSRPLPRGYEDLVREYYRRLGEEPPQ